MTNSMKIYISDMIKYEKEENSKGNTIIYLDREAIIFHLPQDKYYKDYDLFMRGNFGKDGEKRLIQDIKTKENTKYLIPKDYSKDLDYHGCQIPESVIKYIIENYQITGERTLYDIYSKQ
jgi:hypothetical protein